MDDRDILSRVDRLVAEEHELRTRHLAGQLTDAEEQDRLKQVEESLDQCWDLLRQRRALHDAGQNPDAAQARPPSEVEGYLQ
jgi:hypothetical protein